jgi:hypothetical protein
MEQLNWLLSAARQLNAGGAIEDILTTLLQLTLQLTGVERGFVFSARRRGDEARARTECRRSADSRGVDGLAPGHSERAIESDAKFSISDTLTDEKASAWESVMANRDSQHLLHPAAQARGPQPARGPPGASLSGQPAWRGKHERSGSPVARYDRD